MDRVLSCRAQVKTRHLETTRVSVTASVCAALHTTSRSCSHTALGLDPPSGSARLDDNKKRSEKYIDMMYYVPSVSDVFINRLVAKATAKKEIIDSGEEKSVEFSHAEISFPCDNNDFYFDDKKSMGFSIVQNSNVHFRLKAWRDEYVAIRIYIDAEIYQKLYNTCELLAMQKIKFDKVGMYGAVILPIELLQSRTRQQHGTYCSKIITEVLQHCNIGGADFSASKACQSTPTLLYMLLREKTFSKKRAANTSDETVLKNKLLLNS